MSNGNGDESPMRRTAVALLAALAIGVALTVQATELLVATNRGEEVERRQPVTDARLVLWLDAQDIGGTGDEQLSDPVGNGIRVDRWVDKSPHGNHAVQTALDWELEVTRQINGLMDIAVEERDYMGQDFLRWFVTEQREEVSTMTTLLNIVKRAKDNLLRVEEYLARRPDPHAGEAGGEPKAG